MQPEPSWRQIADKQEITDLIYRYCRAMDRMDAPLGYTIWHDDGEADYGPIFQGSGRGFVDWVCDVHKNMLVHSHQVSNIIIALDGDTAASEAYVTAILRYQDGDRLMKITARGRYVDRWSRRAARWGIDKRMFILDFDELQEISATANAGQSRRDHGDASYDVLRNYPAEQ